ncbi:MAG: hypothetical protein H7Y07_01295, partial [Pyrinomonadaceae bacterium]|nr:hypothetical protein [Sphingobacteriaceae bacterium]
MPILKAFRFCFFCWLFLTGSLLYAQFPYNETFTGGTVGANTVFGNSATLMSDILQLTNNSTNQKGHIFIDIPFSSTY